MKSLIRNARSSTSAHRAGASQIQPLEGRVLLSAGDLDTAFGQRGKAVLGDTGDNWAETTFDLVALPGERYVMGVRGRRRDRYDAGEKQTVSEPGFGLTFVEPSGFLRTELTSEPDVPLYPSAVAALPNGDVLLVGSGTGDDLTRIALSRYSGGHFGQPVVTSLKSFAAPGYFNVLATAADATVLPDGKVLVTGTLQRNYLDSHETHPLSTQPFVLRYNPDLTLDRSFGGGDGVALGENWGPGVDLTVAPDGDILVAVGNSDVGDAIPPRYSFGVARFNGDGSLDTTFGAGGLADTINSGLFEETTSVAVAPGGKIIVAGNSDGDFAAARFNNDGSLDTTFGGAGHRARADFGGDDVPRTIAVQADGKFLIGGSTPVSATDSDLAVARFNANGSLDTTFSGDGGTTVNFGADFNDPRSDEIGGFLGIQSDGKVLVAGSTAGTTAGAAVVRLQGDAAAAEQVYQAEAARLAGPIVARDNAGYNGTGYADYTGASGDFVEWSVNSSAEATQRLSFRYANGTAADRPLELRVNGTVVKRVSFPSTGSWAKWDTVFADVPLQDGANTVRVTSVGSNGANVDQLSVRRTPAPPPPPPPSGRVYEAEAAALVGAESHRAYAGYSGAGYADYVHASGDSIQWAVDAATAGTQRLTFRYANGAAGDRPLELRVNGEVVQSRLSFPTTGSWSTWRTVSIDVPLQNGTNAVRLTTAGSNGPNVDNVTVTPAAPPAVEPVSLQAEDARLVGVTRESSNGGYTGAGYADYGNSAGQYVEWTHEVTQAGRYLLEFRYANGTSGNRPLALTIDGATPAGVTNPLAFASTGSWRAYRSTTVTVTLSAGTHRIRLESVGAGPNVDALTIGPA